MSSRKKLFVLAFSHVFIMSLRRIEIESVNLPDLNENPEYRQAETRTNNSDTGTRIRMTDSPDPNENPVQLRRPTENAGSSSRTSPIPQISDYFLSVYETFFINSCSEYVNYCKYLPWKEIQCMDEKKTMTAQKLCLKLWGPKEIVDGQSPFCDVKNHARCNNGKFRVKLFKVKRKQILRGDFLECRCAMYHLSTGKEIKETKTNFFTIKYEESQYFILTNLGNAQLKITGLRSDKT